MPIVIASSSTGRISPTASTTTCVLTNNVLEELGDFPYSDTHSSAPNSTATALTVATDATTRYEVGGVIEWRADCTFEKAIITAVAATTLTIGRGYANTTAASHAAGARFVYNPRFAGNAVQRAVNDSIALDLYPDIYALYQAIFTPASPHNELFEAASDAEKIVRVYQQTTTSPTNFLDTSFSQVKYSDTTISTTGRYFKVPSLRHSTQTVYAQYMVKPAIGDLTTSQARIVELGALWRVLSWEQGEVLDNGEIPQSGTVAPGQQVRTAAFYRALQSELRGRERAALDNLVDRPRRWRGLRHVG